MSETGVLDLRDKTQEYVAKLLVDSGLSSGETQDITRLYGGSNEEYKKVICISLNKTWSIDDFGDVIDLEGPKVIFRLWNGHKVPQRHDVDIHGFVKKDESIDWGIANTMNLMR